MRTRRLLKTMIESHYKEAYFYVQVEQEQILFIKSNMLGCAPTDENIDPNLTATELRAAEVERVVEQARRRLERAVAQLRKLRDEQEKAAASAAVKDAPQQSTQATIGSSSPAAHCNVARNFN